MSISAWAEIVVTIDEDRDYLDESIRWAEDNGFCATSKIGAYEFSVDGEASWFTGEIAWLEDVLRDLNIPSSRWHAHYKYDCSSEYPGDDSCIVEFDVIDGKMCNLKESRIVMVDAEPWFEFGLED